MAKITQKAKLDLLLAFEINESEARALDALAGYGDDAFIEVFYAKLGSAYMEKHEQGLRQFLQSIRKFVPMALGRIDRARKALWEQDHPDIDMPTPKGE